MSYRRFGNGWGKDCRFECVVVVRLEGLDEDCREGFRGGGGFGGDGFIVFGGGVVFHGAEAFGDAHFVVAVAVVVVRRWYLLCFLFEL